MQSLEVVALQSEGRSAIANAYRLGYQSEDYINLAGGKGAWVLHMLRTVLGEDKFARLIAQWRANFGQLSPTNQDFRELAASIAGENLKWFFIQWVDSIGVPQFETEYLLIKTRNGFRITGSIKQDKDLFRMPVELAVESKGKTVRTPVLVQGKRSDFRVDVDSMPTRVLLDPDGALLRDSEDRKVSVYLARGRRQFDRTQFVEAIQQYEEALRLNPRRSLASFYMGEALWEQWNMQSAANVFRDALNGDLEPKWVEVWSYIYLGKIFDVLGQRDRAVAEYQKAVNTKNDFNGAQAEVQKYIKEPFARKRTVLDRP
jgi:tetratricopeptide (TPR) repeat protein